VTAVLTANLGNFDTPVNPVAQTVDFAFHRFEDSNFPPIAGLTPRLQYRIPKLYGWEMFPGYDTYIWLDGSMSFRSPSSVEWFLEKLGDADMALFKHPWRNSMREETDHIEEYLRKGSKYIVPRYRNGLHQEQLDLCLSDPDFEDDRLYTSTAFIYRNTPEVQKAMKCWWYYQSRYFTVDQIVLPYVVRKLKVNTIQENQYRNPYVTLVSRHE
jgi:hypothetical protein